MSADHWTGLSQSTLRGIRIYELAQRLEIPPGDVLRRAQAVAIEVRTVHQSVDRDEVGRILSDYQHPSTDVNGALPHPRVVRNLLADLGMEPLIEPPDPPEPETIELEAPFVEPKVEDLDRGEEPETTGRERLLDLQAVLDHSMEIIRSWYRRLGGRLGLSDHGLRVVRMAIAIVFGTALLATVLAAMRPLYGAESEVVVTIAGSVDAEREMQSFSVVASSQSVLAPVAEELEIPLSDLRDSFSSEIVGDSAVLRFLVIDRDPEQAREVNEAIVASYLSIANSPPEQAQLDFLDAEIADIRENLGVTAARIETLDAAEAIDQATRLRIVTDQEIAQSRLANLESRLVDLQSGGEAPSGAVSFLETQIEETRVLLDALVAELQTLDSVDAVIAQAEADRLRDERDSLREQLGQLEALRVEQALDQAGGPRARVLAPAHVLEEPAGLTPFRALALGILVGGVIASAWVVMVTQFRRRHD